MRCPLISEIHIWRISLDQNWDYSALSSVLSQDELYRWSRFKSLFHQQRFVVSRSSLRWILSLYLQQNPKKLCFSYSPSGKPYLADHALEFNLTHSGGFIVCAISCGVNLGIDVQQEKQYYNDRLARRLLSRQEYDTLQILSAAEQINYFYQIWTGKEALVKARGEKWSFALANVTLPIYGNVADRIGWNLQFFAILPGYQLAIVTGKTVENYLFWECSPEGQKKWLPSMEANLMPF